MEQRQGPERRGAGETGGISLVYCSETNGAPPRGHKQRAPAHVCFNRQELTILLNLYGRNVSAGQWHDYAMDFLRDRALFSIYKRNSQQPVIVVEKNPKMARKQGQYRVIGQQGRMLKRGRDLSLVVRVLDPGFMVVK